MSIEILDVHTGELYTLAIHTTLVLERMNLLFHPTTNMSVFRDFDCHIW